MFRKSEMFATPDNLEALNAWVMEHDESTRVHLITFWGMMNNLIVELVEQKGISVKACIHENYGVQVYSADEDLVEAVGYHEAQEFSDYWLIPKEE